MCGICGYISKRNISLDELKQMNDTMYHRGPNDSGEEIYPLSDGYSIGLAQRRLSICDLSQLGHQPMHSHNHQITVVFNGEIYNFKELKQQLVDYSFVSDCDTEVIIAAYLKWGRDFVHQLNGMFAIAIFDKKTDELLIYRDRMGKKPLYYYVNNEEFVFASELKPIMKYPGFEREINESVIGGYLFHQYICGEQSIFRHVSRLMPGSYLCYKNGQIKLIKYWDVALQYHLNLKKDHISYAEAKAHLKELLVDAVKKRLVADVPVGTFLSGGYDSSLVTAIAQSVSESPVKTFCIGFREKRFNEAEYAKQVAQYLGTEHTELYIDEKEMLDLVDSIPKYYDEPFADSSQMATMLVSMLAKQSVTVALSGDGGDELFCGYTKYENESMAQRLDGLGLAIHFIEKSKLGDKLRIEDRLPYRWKTIVNNADERYKTQYGCVNYIEQVSKLLGKPVEIRFDESHYRVNNWQKRAMLLDQDTYLSDDILCKVDRASMKYSLEARCPILDHRVVEYSYSIPHKYKYFHGEKKHILKDIAYDYIPKDLLDRPKKGFAVPIDQWLRGPLRERLSDYSNQSYLRKQGIFESAFVSQYVQEYLKKGDEIPGRGLEHSRIIWSFFVFQMWEEWVLR